MVAEPGRGSFVSRSVPWTYSYGPLLRIADYLHARRDVRGHMPGSASTTPLMDRLRSTYQEQSQLQFTRAQAALAAPISELREKAALREDLAGRLAEQVARMAAAPPPDLQIRGGGEVHLPLQATAVRRQREHDARRQGEVDAVEAQRERLVRLGADCRQLSASIREEFELACGADEQLRHFTQRRAATYARRLARSPEGGVDTDVEIARPGWTQGECPWVPAGLAGPVADVTYKEIRS